MGVDVVLQRVTDQGTTPRRRQVSPVDSVGDSAEVFVRICRDSALPLLSRVDPYGDLLLTAEDMPRFIGEVDATLEAVDDEERWELLAAVRGLAERCAREASMELHLLGD